INFILSSGGQAVVEENGYIPLDDTKAYKSSVDSGKIVVSGSSSVTPVMEKLIKRSL
ncbi:Phosphate ABC superfamily ATP binding cassette transporter, binding protein, partial [human gut metagenome]